MKLYYTEHYYKNGKSSEQSRFFLKKVLYEYSGLPESVQIRKHSQGRRFVDEAYGVNFSVTHTGSFWICAVSDYRCGIDAELCARTFSRPARLAERFLTEEEQWHVQSGQKDGTESEKLLYLWTRKEAYLKYTGEGLHGLSGAPSVVKAPGGTVLRTRFCSKVCLSICSEAAAGFEKIEVIRMNLPMEA